MAQRNSECVCERWMRVRSLSVGCLCVVVVVDECRMEGMLWVVRVRVQVLIV